jgi:hypothetical protein
MSKWGVKEWSYTLCKSPEIWSEQISLQFFICGANIVEEHYGIRI